MVTHTARISRLGAGANWVKSESDGGTIESCAATVTAKESEVRRPSRARIYNKVYASYPFHLWLQSYGENVKWQRKVRKNYEELTKSKFISIFVNFLLMMLQNRELLFIFAPEKQKLLFALPLERL